MAKFFAQIFAKSKPKTNIMFKKDTVKAFSIVAIALSSVGLLLSTLAALYLKGGTTTLVFAMGIISWSILLWASIIAYKLCSSYKLYDEEYKKVGIRVYIIIVAFFLFFFVGLVLGLVIAVILLGTLWGLKRNYDEWDNNETISYEPASDETNANETTHIS
jgi:hypothetical protein